MTTTRDTRYSYLVNGVEMNPDGSEAGYKLRQAMDEANNSPNWAKIEDHTSASIPSAALDNSPATDAAAKRVEQAVAATMAHEAAINNPRVRVPVSRPSRIIDQNFEQIPAGRMEYVADTAYRSVGAGGYRNQFQCALSMFDRWQHNIMPTNAEHSGYTFITRPHLNLSSPNIRSYRPLMALDTEDANSVPGMIRALLDPRWAMETHSMSNSMLFDPQCPWFTPLCNMMTSCTGWEDVTLTTYDTDGGFFSENQTFAVGGDMLNRTTDLSLTFKDIQHGPIASIFGSWIEYVVAVTRGLVLAYKEDIDRQRMNYTVSIYRFNLDPSRRYITKYAKATGCFPKSYPIGSMINKNENELFVSASGIFSIPFVANKIEYNDPAILLDFYLLTRRYQSAIEEWDVLPMDVTDTHHPKMLPWIRPTKNGLMMQWRVPKLSGIQMAGEPGIDQVTPIA